jgi:hypothetical protein
MCDKKAVISPSTEFFREIAVFIGRLSFPTSFSQEAGQRGFFIRNVFFVAHYSHFYTEHFAVSWKKTHIKH